MWDRYDPRENDRDHGNAWDCSPGGRGGTSDRNWNTERDPRDVFHRDLDLPRGLERRRVRERERVTRSAALRAGCWRQSARSGSCPRAI
jgi:hypothetical protein